MNTKKLMHIEFLRVFFAFCILIVHLKSNILPQWISLQYSDINFYSKSMYFIANLAPHVVNCGFFCVSGYLVSFIYWEKIISGCFDVKKFITTRIYLLYLPYVFVIFIGSVIEYLYAGKLNIWVNLQQILFYGGDWLKLPEANYYLWFMIYEFWFSFFVVSIYWVRVGTLRNKLLGLALIISFCMLVIFKFDIDFVFAWFVSFFFGCISRKIRYVPNVILCAGLILFLVVMYKLSSHYNLINVGVFSILFLYAAIVVFGCVLIVNHIPRAAKNRIEEIIIYLSGYTFSLYLTQGIVIYIYRFYYVRVNYLDLSVFNNFMLSLFLCFFVAYVYKKTIIDLFLYFNKKYIERLGVNA